MGWLWALATVTTVVLNLDTTIVLLTPLYLRIGRHSGSDPVRLAVIPLVLASLSSSVLVVSNLTNLIVADRFGVTSAEVVAHLGTPSLAAIIVGWLVSRRGGTTIRLPRRSGPVDVVAIRVGAVLIVGLLVAFVLGPFWGVAPWMSVVVPDAFLAARVRWMPWRSVLVGTAVAVALLGAVVAFAVPPGLVRPLTGSSSLGATAASAAVGAVGANVVNNLPA